MYASRDAAKTNSKTCSAPPPMPSAWAREVHRTENVVEVQRFYTHVVFETRANGKPLSDIHLV
jgi:hypothetical protein